MQDQDALDYTSVVTSAMLWDMLPAEAVLPLYPDAGLPAPDQEGADFELAASKARRDVISRLLPWIETLSVIAVEIEAIATIRPAAAYLSPLGQQKLREARDSFELRAHDIVVPAACAIISLLVERGFLSVTDRGRTGTLDAFIGS